MTEVVTTQPAPAPVKVYGPHPIIKRKQFLEARIPELQQMLPRASGGLPPGVRAERIIQVAMIAHRKTPELLACSENSIWLALVAAAQDGLVPDGTEGAIVVYNGKAGASAQWQKMYQGLLKQFRRSGECAWIKADVVYEGEKFEHFVDEDGEHFSHVPGEREDGTQVRKAYAAAKTKDGALYVAVLSRAEIEKIRQSSKASRDDSPWNSHFDEMAKKTAIRRLAKYLPMSTDAETDVSVGDYGHLPKVISPPLQPASQRPRVSTQQALDQFAAESEHDAETGEIIEGQDESGT